MAELVIIGVRVRCSV